MKYQKGFGMVEVLIASGIMSVVIVTIIGVYHSLAELSLENTPKIQAAFLLEEGTEAIRLMRDTTWARVASTTLGTTYYLRWQSGSWVATTSPQMVDIFTRTIVFSSVQRDGSFNIVNSGGSVDNSSRKATIAVTWPTQNGTSSRSIDMYIFNTFND